MPAKLYKAIFWTTRHCFGNGITGTMKSVVQCQALLMDMLQIHADSIGTLAKVTSSIKKSQCEIKATYHT